MQRVTVLLALLAACVHCLEKGCEWIGTGPNCGSQNCPAGSIEIVRKEEGISKIAEFGSPCATGQKTLCCKKEVVGSDPKTNCGLPKFPDNYYYIVDGEIKKMQLHGCYEEQMVIIGKKVDNPSNPKNNINVTFCCEKTVLRR